MRPRQVVFSLAIFAIQNMTRAESAGHTGRQSLENVRGDNPAWNQTMNEYRS